MSCRMSSNELYKLYVFFNQGGVASLLQHPDKCKRRAGSGWAVSSDAAMS